MSSLVRLMLVVLGSFAYWALAIRILASILAPCGLGPGMECAPSDAATFWLAAIGFVLVYVALLMRLPISKG